MNAANLARITITCRRCGGLNELTAADVPEGQDILCSRCSSALGTWRELRQPKEQTALMSPAA